MADCGRIIVSDLMYGCKDSGKKRRPRSASVFDLCGQRTWENIIGRHAWRRRRDAAERLRRDEPVPPPSIWSSSLLSMCRTSAFRIDMDDHKTRVEMCVEGNQGRGFWCAMQGALGPRGCWKMTMHCRGVDGVRGEAAILCRESGMTYTAERGWRRLQRVNGEASLHGGVGSGAGF